MDTYIYIKNVRFHAFHGVMPQERSVGTDFLVNLRVKVDLLRAMQSDDVACTVNYASLYEDVKDVMSKPSNIIENVAYRITERIHHDFPQITAADLTITKINPPMGADCDGAGVEIHVDFTAKLANM